MNQILDILKKIIPHKLFVVLQPWWHRSLAFIGHILYGRPSKSIKIVGITGTKGKSSTTEIVDAMLRAGGMKTAVAGTIRFSIGENHEPNLFKQSMPGRFYLQRFLRRAVNTGCDWVVMEMTSEGAKQYRNRWIYLDALIVTNLRPEHLEAHGGFENYKQCKLDIVRHSLNASPKRPRVLIANIDDPHHQEFIDTSHVEEVYRFGASMVKDLTATTEGTSFIFNNQQFNSPLVGEHNAANIHAAMRLGDFAGLDTQQVKQGVESVHVIPGRGQQVDAGQPFTVIVDYAHTNDSLEAMYQAWKDKPIVGILGACGGGRDRWKRPDFGRLAQEYCRYVVLTNEDPYDEDPMQIIEDMESGMDSSREGEQYSKILDRREAFRHAFAQAKPGEVILITGKGTDPYIMGPNGSREYWSDLDVARETLTEMGYNKR